MPRTDVVRRCTVVDELIQFLHNVVIADVCDWRHAVVNRVYCRNTSFINCVNTNYLNVHVTFDCML